MLWSVGGALDFELGGTQFTSRAFSSSPPFLYAMFGTGSMLIIGRSFVRVSEVQNQREAEFRYALTRLRENGESIALLGGEKEERAGLSRNFWRCSKAGAWSCGQWMRTTFVSSTSGLHRGVLPILLCAPKFLAGDMSLGQVMQAASPSSSCRPRSAGWSTTIRASPTGTPMRAASRR